MPTDTSRHLTDRQADDYAQGRLSPTERGRVERHLAGCAACRGLVDGRATMATTLQVFEGSAFDEIREFHAELSGVPVGLLSSKRYRVLKKLGEGGMGAVYQAEQLSLERTVALKVMRPEFVSNEKALSRFRQEAKNAAKLHHPNIVPTYDADREGDTHFIVMGFVEGIDLPKLVKKKGPLDVPLACGLVKQAALALQAAHEQGMVHRDIKPGNLMVTKKGLVTVLDFGLARLARGVDGYVSTTGSVVGTPVFMAPEQAGDPKSVDIRADIYSLGCTLFFLLTGRPVFPKTDIMELMRALALEEPPPLAEFRDDVPEGLEELVSRMLAKDREDRPATPAEVARELVLFTSKPPELVSPGKRVKEDRSRRLPNRFVEREADHDSPIVLTPTKDVEGQLWLLFIGCLVAGCTFRDLIAVSR